MNLEKLKEQLEQALKTASIEELEEFFKDDVPKGWVSIEEHLPKWKAIDFKQGYSVYLVKGNKGVGYTSVTDHDNWYQMAKRNGITHWFND